MAYLKDPRVLFAAERTLLAWNRTSLALIAFGFLVERGGLLLELLGSPDREAAAPWLFWLGLAFILLGATSAAWSTHQYRAVVKSLGPEEIPAGYGTGWATTMNLLVAALGMALALVLTLLG